MTNERNPIELRDEALEAVAGGAGGSDATVRFMVTDICSQLRSLSKRLPKDMTGELNLYADIISNSAISDPEAVIPALSSLMNTLLEIINGRLRDASQIVSAANRIMTIANSLLHHLTEG